MVCKVLKGTLTHTVCLAAGVGILVAVYTAPVWVRFIGEK